LPPPPEPPPGGERLQGLQGSMEASNAVNVALSSLERSEYSSQRKGSAHRHIENEDPLPYSSKVLHLSRSQMSSNCSTTGSSSSRGSTGSRGPPSARKYTESNSGINVLPQDTSTAGSGIKPQPSEVVYYTIYCIYYMGWH
ncbi:roundabout homolog 3-like, partial [Notothenia coriiceps]|uniref:Roundabout homolog 3-like n=1 Tax=Notothenia coriiceps TaxID=8208 RepID=A0A6I9Q0S5_9TELE